MEFDLALVPSVCDNNSDVANIQGRSGNVEDGGDGKRASNTDEIEAAAEGDHEPDSVHRRMRIMIDFAPESEIVVSSCAMILAKSVTYSENGKAASREKAQAILAFASIAVQPVKNCTSMTKNHMTVPPVLPPALKKICATGRPVGVFMMAS